MRTESLEPRRLCSVIVLDAIPPAPFDIASNQVYIHYGTESDPIASVQQAVASGQITNSSLPAGEAIAVVDGADGAVIGLGSGWIEITEALTGDARLTGQVSFGDFQILAANYGAPGGWDDGNFDDDPTVDFNDFEAMAVNFGSSVAKYPFSVAVFTPDSLTIDLGVQSGSVAYGQGGIVAAQALPSGEQFYSADAAGYELVFSDSDGVIDLTANPLT